MEPMPPPQGPSSEPLPHARRSACRAEVWVAWIVLIVGVVALGANFGLLPIQVWDLWRLWPLAIVVAGVAQLARGGFSDLVWGAAIVIYGAGITLTTTHAWSYNFWQAWPIFIVAAGIIMLEGRRDRESWERWVGHWGHTHRRRRAPDWAAARWGDFGAAAGPASTTQGVSSTAAGGDEAWLDLRVMFGQVRRQIKNQTFRGGLINCVFGGCILDLRAMPPPDHPITVHSECVFGGIEIYLPPNWQVILEGHGVFGTFQDETVPIGAIGGPRPTLVLTGSAVFSAVTVK
ncbi:MAG: LiaF transmembrane domain-containing protein [Terriglobales bacterium]